MTWRQGYHLRSVVRSSLWIVPLGSMLLAVVTAPIVRMIDDATRWRLLDFQPDGARVLVGAVVSSGLSFIVFTFSILLVAVQIASSNLSPRVIAPVLGAAPVKVVLGVFIFAYTYSLAALGRVEDPVPQLPVLLTVILKLVSVAAFVYLVDYAARSLRPISVAERVAARGQRVIESVYPRRLSESDGAEAKPVELGPPSRVIPHPAAPGVLVAIDVDGLVRAAEKADCILKLIPQIGDFVSREEPLFHVFGTAKAPCEGALHESVVFGPERTMEQDPACAFRILVDIAAKALSPAINDPTTAVEAIDQIHRLLRLVGMRDLNTGRVMDGAGHLRLVYRTLDWAPPCRIGGIEPLAVSVVVAGVLIDSSSHPLLGEAATSVVFWSCEHIGTATAGLPLCTECANVPPFTR